MRCPALFGAGGKHILRTAALLAHLGFLQMAHLAVDYEFAVITQGDSMLLGKPLSAFGYQVNVRALIQHFARRTNGIANALHTTHSTRPQRSAIHDQSIELDPAVRSEEAASAGVEGFMVFHDHNGFFNRV